MRNFGPPGMPISSRDAFDPDRIYPPSYPSPRPVLPTGPPPSFSKDQQTIGKLIELEKAAWKDEEVVIPLNHWSQRQMFPAVTGTAITFRTPIFDFWYDHLKETAFQSGQVVSAPGPSTAAGTNQQWIQTPGTSQRNAEQWQNHIFEFTTAFVVPSDVSYSISTAVATVLGGMLMQMTDEPFTLSTLNVAADLSKSAAAVFIAGRVPMRFLQFQLTVNLSALSVATSTSFDVVQQLSVRPT